MLYKKLSLVVVLALIAAAAIFGLRSWVASDAPQSAPVVAPTTAPATNAPTNVPSATPTVTPTPSAKPKPKPKPKPTIGQKPAAQPNANTRPTVRYTSGHYIATGVASALNAKSRINTRVVCPQRIPLVPQAVITCNVYNTADKRNVPLARVTARILDRSGRFTWTSVSLR